MFGVLSILARQPDNKPSYPAVAGLAGLALSHPRFVTRAPRLFTAVTFSLRAFSNFREHGLCSLPLPSSELASVRQPPTL